MEVKPVKPVKPKTKCPQCAKSFINLKEHINKMHKVCACCKMAEPDKKSRTKMTTMWKLDDWDQEGSPDEVIYGCQGCMWENGYTISNDNLDYDVWLKDKHYDEWLEEQDDKYRREAANP